MQVANFKAVAYRMGIERLHAAIYGFLAGILSAYMPRLHKGLPYRRNKVFNIKRKTARKNRDGKIQEKFMRCKNRRYRLRSLRGTLPGTGNRDDSFRQT